VDILQKDLLEFEDLYSNLSKAEPGSCKNQCTGIAAVVGAPKQKSTKKRKASSQFSLFLWLR